jgi:hypothetical protein
MKRLLVLIAALGVSCGASAQAYKWKDANGHTRYGDTPPPGVDATPIRGPAARPAPPAAPEAKKADDKADKPLSPEAAFQKRQQEREEAEQKAAKERAQADEKRANCAAAQGQLRNLESGVRMSTVNASGERVFLDDEARSREMQRAQKAVADFCG